MKYINKQIYYLTQDLNHIRYLLLINFLLYIEREKYEDK